jgi:starch synthase
MNVLFVSSEVAPFAKSGGLGDVSAALPRQLHAVGHDVRIVMPMYPRVRNVKGAVFVEAVNDLVLQLGTHTVHFSIWVTHMPGTTLPVYMVRCPGLYDRPSLYGQAPDEHLRFIVLSYAAFKVAQHTGFAPDVLHCNDWQTGLAPAYLSFDRRARPASQAAGQTPSPAGCAGSVNPQVPMPACRPTTAGASWQHGCCRRSCAANA